MTNLIEAAAAGEARSRFAQIVDSSEDAIVSTSLDGMVEHWNPAAQQLFGYTFKEAVGQPIQRLIIPPERVGETTQRLAAIGRDERVVRTETVWMRKDGTRLEVSLTASPIHDATGVIIGMSLFLRDISARKRAQDESHAASGYARSLIEASLDPLVTISAQGKITDVNEGTVRATGVPREALIGSDFSDYFTQPEKARSGYLEAFAQGSVTDYPLSLRHVSGTSREVVYNASIFRNQNGEAAGVFAAARDITERKRAEEALYKSERHFRKLIEGGADAFFVTDGAGILLYRSDSGKKMTGYDTDELLGKPVTAFVCPDDLPIAQGAIAEALRKPGQPVHAEFRIMHKDGTVRHIEISGKNLLDDPDVTGLVVTARDVSERKRLEEQRNQYFRFFTLSTDLMCIADPFGCFKHINPAFVKLTGYSEAELLSKPFLDFVLPEDRQKTKDEMELQVKVRASMYFENRYVCKDGSTVCLAWTAFFDKKDGVTYATARDVTERKQGELALATANRALRALSACNEVLVRAANEPELLNVICQLLVETGGYRLAWVGFPEQDEAKTVRVVARHGHDEGYLAAANISWADTELGRGPTGAALRTGTVQVNQNFPTNPTLAPWRTAALARGYLSSIALPLKNTLATLGVLTIYASVPDAFNEAEVTLLQELADDLAFGIQTQRTNAERDHAVQEQLHHTEILRQSLEESVKAIANTLELRDPYTAGHQRRVGQLAVAIARELGLPDTTNRGIELAASIHDLGKISIPSEILVKPGKLSDIEFMLLKNHAQAGFDILKDIKFPWPIAAMVLQHHERLDGSGYPQGLKGEQIMLESRILAVADVVEAMASHRPYRAAQTIESALQEIERGRGTVYDSAVVDACTRLFLEKRFAF